MGLLGVLAVYFLASPSGSIISDDGSKFFAPIITELVVGDTSSVIYDKPLRGEFFGEQMTFLKETGLIIFVIFVFQFFTYLTLQGMVTFKRFKPYIWINTKVSS